MASGAGKRRSALQHDLLDHLEREEGSGYRHHIVSARIAGRSKRDVAISCRRFGDLRQQHRLGLTASTLASGRVRSFPMSEYLGDRRFRSRLTDQVTEVTAHRAVVDATYMASRVPGADPPPFTVADACRSAN